MFKKINQHLLAIFCCFISITHASPYTFSDLDDLSNSENSPKKESFNLPGTEDTQNVSPENTNQKSEPISQTLELTKQNDFEKDERAQHPTTTSEPSKQQAYESTDIDLKDNQKTKSNVWTSDNQFSIMMIFSLVFMAGVLFLVYWYLKHIRRRVESDKVPISVLGQTFLDATTRIILLKVGAKIIVLAKSPQFCTSLDVISDPEEVNLLTLSSGLKEQQPFGPILKGFQNKSSASKKASIPNANEMQMELQELKKQLGNLK